MATDNNDSEFVTLYVMAENEDVGVHMATALVKERLVACANVNTGTRSIFEWDGLIHLENEVTIFMKTTRDKVEGAVRRIKELHSYDVPCITAMPIVDGNPDYLAWIRQQVDADIHQTFEH